MQLDSRDSVLMWIGNQRATGEVPAWCFKVDSKDFGALRGVLAKAIIETKTRLVASS
jgi:IS1 family transposase